MAPTEKDDYKWHKTKGTDKKENEARQENQYRLERGGGSTMNTNKETFNTKDIRLRAQRLRNTQVDELATRIPQKHVGFLSGEVSPYTHFIA